MEQWVYPYVYKNMQRITYTGATFDLFHSGHVNFLRQCRLITGDGKLIVSLNTDEFIIEYKGKPPVMSYKEREKVLRSCRYVDDVIPNVGGKDSRIAIEQVKPQFIIIGSDWAKKDYYRQMSFTQEWLDERNIVLCYVPYTENISTTDIKRRVACATHA